MAQLSIVEGRPPSWAAPIEEVKRAHVAKEKSFGLPGYHLRLFTPHNKLQTVGPSGSAWTVDTDSGATKRQRTGDWYLCVAWRPDGAQVAVGCEYGGVIILTPSTGAEDVVLPHPSRVPSVAWSPNGRKVATGCVDTLVRIFDAESGVLERKFKHRGSIRQVSWHPDGGKLASGCGDNTLRIFDTETGRQEIIEQHIDCVWSAVWSPDGSKMATGCADRHARVFDVCTTPTLLLKLPHRDGVRSVAWKTDGAKLATGCNDKCARVIDAASGDTDWQFRHGDQVSCVAWKPHTDLLATASVDKCARVFDTRSGEQLHLFRYGNQVTYLAWELPGELGPKESHTSTRGDWHGFVAAVFGPPMCGKGTLCQKLVKDFGFHRISDIRDLLRAEVQAGTELSARAQQYLDAGEFGPDDFVIELIKRAALRAKTQRLVLDDFPHTEGQADELNRQLKVDTVYNMRVPTQELVNRARGRWMHLASGRSYDYTYKPPTVEGRDDETGEPLVQRADKPEVVLEQLSSSGSRRNSIVAHLQCNGTNVVELDGSDRPALVADGRRSDAIYASVKTHMKQFLDWFVVVVIGPPGAAKEKACKEMVGKYGFSHIPVDDVIKKEIRAATAWGKKAKLHLDAEGAVPDALMVELVVREAASAPKGRVLLDGFPVTTAQAEELGKHTKVRMVLHSAGRNDEAAQHSGSQKAGPASRQIRGYSSNPPAVDGRDNRGDAAALSSSTQRVKLASGCAREYNAIPPELVGKHDQSGDYLTRQEEDKPGALHRSAAACEQTTHPLLNFYRARGTLTDLDVGAQPESAAENHRIDTVLSSLRPLVEAHLPPTQPKSEAIAPGGFRSYYKAHMGSCLVHTLHSLYRRFPAAARAAVTSLSPFRHYYVANILTCSIPTSIHTNFPAYARYHDRRAEHSLRKTPLLHQREEHGIVKSAVGAPKVQRAYFLQIMPQCPRSFFDELHRRFQTH